MRLMQPVPDVGARTIRVPCLTCGRMHYLADSVVDLAGPAFKAYYCPKHVPTAEVDRREAQAWCDRNHVPNRQEA